MYHFFPPWPYHKWNVLTNHVKKQEQPTTKRFYLKEFVFSMENDYMVEWKILLDWWINKVQKCKKIIWQERK